ncbi:MAG: IclR family transcriptional regulator [Acidimicrobiia bacterium]|nr:IclR family transcriptional regulator [Acidimicrobiia bacterium]
MASNVGRVGVIDKALLVLGSLEQGPRSLAELVEESGLSRATAHRLAVALEGHGLVRRGPDGRFLLGYRLLSFGRAAASQIPLVDVAQPHLVRLRDETGESAQLYVRDGDERVCVAVAESQYGLRTIVSVGSRLTMERGSAANVLRGEVPAAASHASVEEREPGVASVSAAITGPGGEIVAAVSVSGPIDRTTRQPDLRYGPAVRAVAAAMSAELGAR